MQVLGRAPHMRNFRMASSRVGAEGGIALAQGLTGGDARAITVLRPSWPL